MRAIDSSSLAKFFSREEGWDKVKDVMLEGVVTLDLAIKEVASVLWKKVLRNEISRRTAETILKNLAEEKAIPIINQEKFITKAFTLAVNEKITVYDALFIIAAKELNMELVTGDREQAEAAARSGIKVIFIE